MRVQTDMCRRAICLLSTFYAANPTVKTILFRSLYDSALRRLSSSSICSLEVTFNNLLRKIWKLPRDCHASILHCISSVFTVVIIVPACSVRKQEPQEFVTSSQKHLNYHIITINTGKPTVMLIKCAQTL